jgi:hypothetical protein
VVDDLQVLPLDYYTVFVGTAPPEGTRYKMYANSWVVTAGVFADTYCPLAGNFAYGWSVMAMIGDAAPQWCMGITVYLATCKLDTLGGLVWGYAGQPLIQNAACRINAFVIGA